MRVKIWTEDSGGIDIGDCALEDLPALLDELVGHPIRVGDAEPFVGPHFVEWCVSDDGAEPYVLVVHRDR